MYRLYLGHHKCACQSTHAIFSNWRRKMGLDLITELNAHKSVRLRDDYVVAYLNSSYEVLPDCDFRAFHVIRDPRDIIVSAYYSHKYSHHQVNFKEGHKERLNNISEEDGLFEELDCRAKQFEDFNNWNYQDSRILEMKFEDLVGSKREQLFLHIAKWLDIPLTKKEILEPVRNNSFFKLSGGRSRGKENTKHHYRKGISGDWEKRLPSNVLDAFYNKYPTLLEKMGYDHR